MDPVYGRVRIPVECSTGDGQEGVRESTLYYTAYTATYFIMFPLNRRKALLSTFSHLVPPIRPNAVYNPEFTHTHRLPPTMPHILATTSLKAPNSLQSAIPPKQKKTNAPASERGAKAGRRMTVSCRTFMTSSATGIIVCG